ncbi:MAG: ABC transporter permease [Gemmatimonadota bacterium]|nr:MAG: ABC transporter permease [Gemmatimonadota bacterium]
MNFRKVRHVVRREYLESVRKRSFLLGLVATPLMMGAMIFLPFVSEGLVSQEEMRVSILDRTGRYGAALIADASPDLILTLAPPGMAEEELDARVAAEVLTGWILIPEDFAETGECTYRSGSITNLAVLESLRTRLGLSLAGAKAQELGLPSEDVESLLRPAEMRTVRVGHAGAREGDFTQVYLRAVMLVMTMFFALIPTGQILMRSVIEEKSNRVIEVLLSSVTPLELMVGKIIGLGAVGLTLLGAWASVGVLLSLRLGTSLPISGGEIGMFVLYFLPGYFFFAALLGSIGSICSAERDAQPFLMPISLTLILPVMMGMAIAQAPDHWVARAFSFFPPLTPSLMLFRYAIKEPPAWEILATWTTLVLATIAMFGVSARVFRVGILMTGKRPTLPEIARWARER